MKITFTTYSDSDYDLLTIGREEIDVDFVLRLTVEKALLSHDAQRRGLNRLELETSSGKFVADLIRSLLEKREKEAQQNYKLRELANPTEHILLHALKYAGFCHDDGSRVEADKLPPVWVQEAWKALNL
jgi:hypothetical protein